MLWHGQEKLNMGEASTEMLTRRSSDDSRRRGGRSKAADWPGDPKSARNPTPKKHRAAVHACDNDSLAAQGHQIQA